MTQAHMTIDLNNFSRLDPARRIAFLEGAMMFGVIPEENIPTTKAYISKLTASIVDPVQEKTLVLEGGIHKIASVIRETFPHVIQLKNEISTSILEDFAKTHQISHEDFVGCGGMDSEWSVCSLICFKNSSDAILAKLYFRDSVFYADDQGPEQIEMHVANTKAMMMKASSGHKASANRIYDGDACCDSDESSSTVATVIATKRA